jgi:hypothetical protein
VNCHTDAIPAYAILFCLIALAAIGSAVYPAVATPTVNAWPSSRRHIERAASSQKRSARHEAGGTISPSQEDVDLLNYLASRYAKEVRIVLLPAAAISASIELPRNPVGRFLNISAVLHETAALPAFDSLKLGRLPVPAWLADSLLENVVQRLNTREDYRIAGDTIKKVSVSDGRLTVTYDWQADLPDRIKAVMLPREDQERLKAYQDRLAGIGRQLPGGASVRSSIC